MMWPYGGDGWTVLWGMGMMVLFWGALFALVIWTVRTITSPKPSGDSAVETLRRRFASGEISQEDFERTKKALGS